MKEFSYKPKSGPELVEYKHIHKWLKRNCPNYTHCSFCHKKSKYTLHFALIHGYKHGRFPERYVQLCKGCHSTYDGKREIYQFSLDGVLISRFDSVRHAAKILDLENGAISRAITRGGRGGLYVFSFTPDCPDQLTTMYRARVLAYKISGEYLGEFDSPKEAGKHFGFSTPRVRLVCTGVHKQTDGIVFRYKHKLEDMAAKRTI